MPLISRLFRDNARLQACLVSDPAHLTPGCSGEHVQLVQRALVWLGDTHIRAEEYKRGVYGKTTAEAVLAYKSANRIINPAYQKTVDDIVGKMTIRALDLDVLRVENISR